MKIRLNLRREEELPKTENIEGVDVVSTDRRKNLHLPLKVRKAV